MKKYITQIVAAFALITVFVSCSSEDSPVAYGGSVAPATLSISRLDNNYDLPLNIFTKSGVTISKIEIYKNTVKDNDPIVLGVKVGDAALRDGKATFNASLLGSFDVFPETSGTTTTLTGKTGTFQLAILTTYSNNSTTKSVIFNLEVGKGIVWQAYDADGKNPVTSKTSGVSTIKYLDPTPVKITFAPVNKETTTVNSIVGEWSKNGGTYSVLPGGEALPITHQDINIAAIPYSTYGGITPEDKITYRFTVTAGTQTDVISTEITFANQKFGAERTGSISNSDDTSKFSFAAGLNYGRTDTKNAEINFSDAYGFKKSRTDVRVLFVKSTLDFDTASLFDAETAFNAGSQVTELNNLSTYDVVLYKITRNIDVNVGTKKDPNFKDITYYGLVKITAKVDGINNNQKLLFSYKEGVLSQKVPTPPVVVTPTP